MSISVVFSEPMNKETTQAAYSSAELPASAVTFSWSTDDTVLTIDPSSDLSYAADTVPSTAAAKKYEFAIATTATDRAENRLQTELISSFATSREVAQTLGGEIWQLLGQDEQGTDAYSCPEGVILVGDHDSLSNGSFYSGILQFDLSVLAPGIQSFTEATLRARQEGVEGTPFGTSQLGNILLHHTNFDPISLDSIAGAPLRALGVFSNSPLYGLRSVDVLVAVNDDHASRLERSYRSQYRLAFTTRSNRNQISDVALFNCTPELQPELVLKYLVP